MFKREPTRKKPPCFLTLFSFTIEIIPIYDFNPEGTPIYARSDKSGYNIGMYFSAASVPKKIISLLITGKTEESLKDYYDKFIPPPTNDEPIIPTGWDDNDDDCSQMHKNGIGIIVYLHLLLRHNYVSSTTTRGLSA
ncbi:hypothetical protein Adt_04572 [Abeliophyllum distichum]|uniref:Uncharacterized protein n=1 Tax=Abeliophyllum distichum TaxID=126358 RepID=A0ABD1V1M5_9LAMI